MSRNRPLIIETVADDLEKAACEHLPLRRGSRAIFFVDGKLCLLHLKNIERYTLPGGGIEPDETAEEALIREVKEETGYTVATFEKTVILKEYFPDSRWEHHYYRCTVKGRPDELKLTEEESDTFGLRVTLKPLEEALQIFSDPETSTLEPYTPAIHTRELMGLIHSLED